MTRYWGVDHSSNDLRGAAEWCRNNAIDECDDDERPSRRSTLRGCSCNSMSESPCEYCESFDEEYWCSDCENHVDDCVCDEEEAA